MSFVAVTTLYSGRISAIIDNEDGVDLYWLGKIIMGNVPVVKNHRVTSVSYGPQTRWDNERRESVHTGKWTLEVAWEEVQESYDTPEAPHQQGQITPR